MEEKIYSQVEMVKTESLKPNSYNPNEMDEKRLQYLIDDFKQNGFVGQPIIVNQENEIIDGEHRWQAAKFLNYDKVPVVKYNPQDEDHQKMLTIGWNSKRGDFNPTKLARIILELNQKHSLEELSSKLGFSQEELKDKLSLSEVTEEFMENIKKQAQQRQLEIPTAINFAVTKEQEQVILEALDKAEGKLRGEKLHFICKEFLNGKASL